MATRHRIREPTSTAAPGPSRSTFRCRPHTVCPCQMVLYSQPVVFYRSLQEPRSISATLAVSALPVRFRARSATFGLAAPIRGGRLLAEPVDSAYLRPPRTRLRQRDDEQRLRCAQLSVRWRLYVRCRHLRNQSGTVGRDDFKQAVVDQSPVGVSATSGATVTVPDGSSGVILVCNSSTTLASLTVKRPPNPSPRKRFETGPQCAVTALTVNAGTSTGGVTPVVLGTPAGVTPSAPVTWIEEQTGKAWTRW